MVGATSVKWCEKQLEISHGTVVDWNNYMREVCVDSSLKRQQRKTVGGDIIEVDENLPYCLQDLPEMSLPLHQHCVQTGFTRWKKASERIPEHEASKIHR
ncbi:hypothetical protein X975_14371, partial [Stegodyphus mimosarum]